MASKAFCRSSKLVRISSNCLCHWLNKSSDNIAFMFMNRGAWSEIRNARDLYQANHAVASATIDRPRCERTRGQDSRPPPPNPITTTSVKRHDCGGCPDVVSRGVTRVVVSDPDPPSACRSLRFFLDKAASWLYASLSRSWLRCLTVRRDGCVRSISRDCRSEDAATAREATAAFGAPPGIFDNITTPEERRAWAQARNLSCSARVSGQAGCKMQTHPPVRFRG